MATYSKTQGTTVLTLQSVASGAVLTSSAIDVSTVIAATIFIHFGRRATTALTTGTEIRIEASSKSSLDGHWYPLFVYTSDIAAAEAENISNTESAGATTIEVASTTNILAGSLVFFDNGTITNGEFHRVKSISTNTNFVIEDGLLNSQASGTTIYTQAQIFRPVDINCRAIGRLRVVVDNKGTGQAIAVEAHVVTANGFA